MKDNIREESQLILDHFGKDKQIIKIGEECSELATVILKSLCSTKDKEQIESEMYSELADVYNVMKQALLIFDAERIMDIAQSKRTKCINSYIKNV